MCPHVPWYEAMSHNPGSMMGHCTEAATAGRMYCASNKTPKQIMTLHAHTVFDKGRVGSAGDQRGF